MFPAYTFDSNFFEINRRKLHYIDHGKGPVVVMVHGNPTWSYYYRHLIRELSSHFRVIVPDHMGCGLSDKPQRYQYTLQTHITNLKRLLLHLKVDSYSLVVHDWGGPIGLGSGIGCIENIKKIVVTNSAAFRSTNIPYRIQLCKIPLLGELIVRGFNGFAWPATFMAVANKMAPEVARAYTAPYDSWENRIATHRFVVDIPLSQSHKSYKKLVEVEQLLPRIKELGIPLQLIWGGRDFCFNKSFFNEWRRWFPDSEAHYFKNGGHYILEDERDKANYLIKHFLFK